MADNVQDMNRMTALLEQLTQAVVRLAAAMEQRQPAAAQAPAQAGPPDAAQALGGIPGPMAALIASTPAVMNNLAADDRKAVARAARDWRKWGRHGKDKPEPDALGADRLPAPGAGPDVPLQDLPDLDAPPQAPPMPFEPPDVPLFPAIGGFAMRSADVSRMPAAMNTHWNEHDEQENSDAARNSFFDRTREWTTREAHLWQKAAQDLATDYHRLENVDGYFAGERTDLV